MKPTPALIAALSFALAPVNAFALDDPHAEAVTRTVLAAKGKVEKTEDGQSLKLVDLAVPGAGPHDHRKDDPYDAAFFEHLGQITTLESLNIISTKFNDAWMPHIAKLTNLKTLRLTNNGKLTDAGMEQLAGLKNLETFSFIGTQRLSGNVVSCQRFRKMLAGNGMTAANSPGGRTDAEGLPQRFDRQSMADS